MFAGTEKNKNHRTNYSLSEIPAILTDSFPELVEHYNSLTTNTAGLRYLINLAEQNKKLQNQLYRFDINQSRDSSTCRYPLTSFLALAIANERANNSDSVIWYYKLGIETARKFKVNPDNLSLLYRGIGRFYVKHSDYATAIINYNRALILSNRIHDSVNHLTYLSEAGKIYYAMNEIDKAVECFEKARDFGRRTGNLLLMVHSLNSLGDIKRVQHKFTEAIRYHEEAMEANKKLTGAQYENWSCT